MRIKIIILLSIISVISLFLYLMCYSENKSEHGDPFRINGENRLSNIKMLTDASENAEAYLSFNEQMLFYQATTEDWECDQQFLMNINGTQKRLISTGLGRTTCGYFLPGDTTVLYASTHLADEECPPPPDLSHGYVWKLYDSYDIFLANLEGSILKRLTDSLEYDVEATVSPKGDRIVFTSMRDGEPEIYSMDLNGKNQKRLTFEKGYDGGPFFSWDSSKIVFRASRLQTEEELKDYKDLVENGLVRPTTLEIYIMNADGSNIQRVTHFGKASFMLLFCIRIMKELYFLPMFKAKIAETLIYTSLMWMEQAWRESPKTIRLMVFPFSLVMGKMWFSAPTDLIRNKERPMFLLPSG